MTKAELTNRLQERFEYLRQHCDTDEELATLKWFADHICDELGISFNVGDYPARPYSPVRHK